ncbi:MAG: hypothetical protein FWG11_04230 [Promicromonosporaceae bacterium]|nr:hypothetical protein [Promicromonosporaceae bacterium]
MFEQPTFTERAAAGAMARRKSTAGQILFIVLGIVCGLSAIVAPWCAGCMRADLRDRRPTEARWTVGLVIASSITVIFSSIFLAMAFLPDEDFSAGGRAVVAIMGFFGLASLLTSGLLLGTALLQRRGRVKAQSRKAIDKELFDKSEISQALAASLRTLTTLQGTYQGYRIGAVAVSDQIHQVVAGMQEFMRRLRAAGTEQQVRMAKLEYRRTLDQVCKLVSPSYLKDIIDNPGLWSDPQKRMVEVRVTLDAVNRQITENIRQLNSRTDLDFQVALASLTQATAADEYHKLYGGKL